MAGVLTIDNVSAKRIRFVETVRQKFGVENPVISLTDLRAEALLNPSKNNYKMKLKNLGSTTSDLEKRMEDTHLFLPLYVTVNIQKVNKDTEAAGAPDFDSNYRLWTYADANFFVGANAGNLEVTALEKIWQGELILTKSGNSLIPGMSTHNMKYVPNQQYMTPAATGMPNPTFPQYGPSLAERGYTPLYSEVILEGKDDNQVELELGSGNINLIAGGVDAAGAETKFCNKLIVMYHGFHYFGDDFGKLSNSCLLQ